jgi:hypothetical protein
MSIQTIAKDGQKIIRRGKAQTRKKNRENKSVIQNVSLNFCNL